MNIKDRKAIRLAQYVIKNTHNEHEKHIAQWLLIRILKRIFKVTTIVILFFLTNCNKEVIQLQPEIFNATCQKWYGGHEDTGKGSLYYIYTKYSKDIVFNTLRTDSLYTVRTTVINDTIRICVRTYTKPLNETGVLYYNNDSILVSFEKLNKLNYQ